MTPTEFGQLKAFLAVFHQRNFRRAALRLGVSPSALSRTVRELEDRLGARLFNRTTRSVSPTEAGLALQSRIEPMLGEIDAALEEVRNLRSTATGTVRVNLSQVAARIAILPRLPAFMAAFPDVDVDLVVDNNMTDVVAQGFDAGIRIGSRVGQDMIAVRLTPDFRMAVVASPAYLERRPPPVRPADLAQHRCLTYKWDATGALYPWSFEGPSGRAGVEVASVLTANDTDLLLAAAVRGLGIAYLAETAVEGETARGTLVRLLDDWCGPMPGFHLYYSSRRHMPAALRSFVDFMKLGGPANPAASPGA